MLIDSSGRMAGRFGWVRTDREGESAFMYCSDCQNTRQKNGFTRGCKNFQRSALVEHSKSLSHRNAVGTAVKTDTNKADVRRC